MKKLRPGIHFDESTWSPVEGGTAKFTSVRPKAVVDVHVLAVALLGAETLGADLADVGLHIVGRVVGEDVTRIFAGGHLKLL